MNDLKRDELLGIIIGENYLVEELIGKGSMGKVYMCKNLKLDNYWAVKVVNKEYEFSKYFRKEAEILKKINHPNIPKIADLFEDEKNIYIVESYIEGILLSEKISKEGKISELETLNYLIQLSEIIEYLHNIKPNPIVYRDLKPNNVIVSFNNRLVLVDFSISKIQNELEEEDTIIAGNRFYSSPEQMSLDLKSDERSDIYSLGMLAFRMSTGKLKSEINIKEDDMYEMSDDLKKIVKKCTNINLEKRYQNISELKNDLIRISENLSEIKISMPKIILVDGVENSGKTFLAVTLANTYSNNKNKVALLDLSFELGVAEYFNISVDENIGGCQSKSEVKEILNNAYKENKYLDVYKGEFDSEKLLLEFVLRISKKYDIVIIDSCKVNFEKMYEYVDVTLFVITQDEKIENLSNKKMVDYVDKKINFSNVKLIINKYEREISKASAIINELNIVPKIFKSKSILKEYHIFPNIKRIHVLKSIQEKNFKNIFEESKDEISIIANDLCPLKVLRYKYEKVEEKSLLKEIGRKYKIFKNLNNKFLKGSKNE